MSETVTTIKKPALRRDHSMFEAELSGAVLNVHLFVRILHWLKPYKLILALSGVLVLLSSACTVLMEVVISRVLVDYIITGSQSQDAPRVEMPDLYMIDLTRWLENWLEMEPIYAAGVLFFVLMIGSTIVGHWHRLTLVSAIVHGLRDLRQDLFAHLEARPSCG